MDEAIQHIITDGGDDFSFALKTESQKFAFLMGEGIKQDDARYGQFRKIELAFYKFLSAAEKRRKEILADRLPDRRTSESDRMGSR